MYGYENAASGLKKMFTAQVGGIICVVLMMIPFIGVIGLIGVFVFGIMSLIGLNSAGKDIGRLQNSLYTYHCTDGRKCNR